MACKIIFAIVFLSGAAIHPLYSQAFKNPPEGPASISQAGAFVAQCDDATAITHNPAGLVQLQGQQVLLGSTFLISTVSYSGEGFSADKEFTPGFMPYVYYATDMGSDNMRFGIGISSPYGQTTEWSKKAVRHWNYEVPLHSSMRVIDVSPAVALRITPELSAGAGLNIYHSTVEMKNLVPDPFKQGEMTASIKADTMAYGGTFGLLYKTEGYSLGMNYRSGFNAKHKGKLNLPAFDLNENVSVGLQMPDIISTGIAVYPRDGLKVEFNAEWYGYSSFKNIPVTVVGDTEKIEKNWKDSYLFSLGTELRRSERIKVRAGIAYMTNPVPNQTWEPSIPSAESVILSLGSAMTTDRGIFEFGMGVNLLKTTERENLYEGKYESRGYFLSLGYKKNI